MEEAHDSDTSPAARRHSRRAWYLLVSLMLMIFLPPFLHGGGIGVIILRGLNLVLLLASARAAITSRRELIAIGGLLTFTAVMLVAHWQTDDLWVVYGFLAGSVAFFLAVAITLLIDLFRPATSVTVSAIVGATSVYLLLGLIWALAYAILEFTNPGSFSVQSSVDLSGLDGPGHYQRFIGFSFITLTTLGYGHISPANLQADALTSAEAIVGQFYIAVVVARLVALQLVESTRK
ncbi:MAG: voltage-gated potassium channel [Candidatus Paceibacteria bacterium]|jgi:voltage-gated potassium channel